MLKFFALMTIFLTNSSLAMEVCQYGKLRVLDNDFFNDLAMPNCTEVRPMQNLMCGCAEKLDKFFQDKRITKFDFNAPSSKRKKQDELFRMAETKLVALINDLNFANNFLELDSNSKKEITGSCNLNILNDQLSEPSCRGGNNIINKITNNNPSQLMNILKEEGKILISKDFSSSSEGFFNRTSSKNSCHIPDSDIFKYKNILEISAALSSNRKDLLQSSPFGYHVVESGIVDEESFHQSTKNLKNISEYITLMNSTENLNKFKAGFIKNCKSTFKSVRETLCSDFKVETPKPKDFLEQAKVEIQYPEDIDSSPKLQDKYLQDQLKILSYCKGIEEDKVNSSSNVSNTYESLRNVLLYEKKDTTQIYLDNTNTIQLENDKSYKNTYISKVREGTYSLTAASRNENYKQLAYDESYQYERNILCKESNRPLKVSELLARGCSIDDFSKNFKKNYTSDVKERNCSLLVIDYILNTPTQELETQKVDKNLLAYKKTIEENKKTNGGDLILDFLGVESKKDIESFKAAGIERKSPATSNENQTKKSSNNDVVAFNQPPVANQVIEASTKEAKPGQAQTPQTYNQQAYTSSPTYQAMTPKEKTQVGDVERELMRRLMGSKVSESTNAAKAEMYQKYSKEMMELAKEKARLEASGENSKPSDLASYEKKMQDLVDQMKEENKKLASSQMNSQGGGNESALTSETNKSSKGVGPQANYISSSPTAQSTGIEASNSNLNRALNETVNADKYAELTGKKPAQEARPSRGLASEEGAFSLTLIENNKEIDISSLEEVFSKKIKEKKPFVIAQKNNPEFKVRITPDQNNKVTITPLGNLNDPSYKKFYEEIEESFKTDKELQKYHRQELVDSLSEFR